MLKTHILFIITLILLAGCGGGGGNSGTINQQTVAKVILVTQGTAPSGKLSGIGITMQLPAGVTPALANGAVDVGVVKGTGKLATDYGLDMLQYTPANGTDLGTLSFVMYSTVNEGFDIGEFATLTFKIAAGAVNFSNIDLNSSSGSTTGVTNAFKVTSASPVDRVSSAKLSSVSVSFTAEVF